LVKNKNGYQIFDLLPYDDENKSKKDVGDGLSGGWVLEFDL